MIENLATHYVKKKFIFILTLLNCYALSVNKIKKVLVASNLILSFIETNYYHRRHSRGLG